MNHRKISIIISCYCAILWLTNWSLTYEYNRESGLKSSSISPIGFGVIVSFVMVIILLIAIWKQIRVLLESEIMIPRNIRLFGYKIYCFLLIPLAFRIQEAYPIIDTDGTKGTKFYSYGGEISSYTIVWTAIAIMLFQLYINLREKLRNQVVA